MFYDNPVYNTSTCNDKGFTLNTTMSSPGSTHSPSSASGVRVMGAFQSGVKKNTHDCLVGPFTTLASEREKMG